MRTIIRKICTAKEKVAFEGLNRVFERVNWSKLEEAGDFAVFWCEQKPLSYLQIFDLAFTLQN